jgi:hypothetical protein
VKRITDKDFEYTNAADTSKPGYLAAKFAKIRRELDAAMVKPPKPAVVSPIKRGH